MTAKLTSPKGKFKLSKFLVSLEMILIYVLIAINASLMILRPEIYFCPGTVQTIIRSGMDLSVMVLGMIFVIILGEIDVSVASVMLISCMVTGVMYERGINPVIATICGIITGALCGAFNGVLISLLKLPSVIVTIVTAMFFRGVVTVILKGNSLKVFPSAFSTLYNKDLFGIFPCSMILFLVLAVIFGIILHKTKFGRSLYIMGSNEKVAEYSGIKVKNIKIAVFVIMGITAAVSGIIFAGRFGSINSSITEGYELRVIAITVLGGISTNGGTGKIYGPVIATFIMACLNKTLEILNIPTLTQKIIIGIILIVAVVIPIANNKMMKLIRK